ncbi:MAG: hypothetical protein ACO2ZZ_14150, partial [Cyclobacteriaceae bacterium]
MIAPIKYLNISLLCIFCIYISNTAFGQIRAYQPPEFAKNWSKPGQHPDHIILNYGADPATTASVTWRTSAEVSEGILQIAVATGAPK